MLEMIADRTGYIPGAVNVGVFMLRDEGCVLVDTGLDDRSAKNIMKVLESNRLSVKKIFITHSHADHIGGASWLQRHTNAEVYTSQWESSFMVNPGLEPFYLYSASPIAELTTKFFQAKPCTSVNAVVPGEEMDEIDILDLSGHSPGMIGFRTSDEVICTADAYFSKEVLDKYFIPYFADIEKSLATLERLKTMDARCFLPAHGCPSDQIESLIQYNQERILTIQEEIVRYLTEVNCSREQLIARFAVDRKIELNAGQYFLISSTISSFLAFMANQGQILLSCKDGYLQWGLSPETRDMQ